MNTRTTVVLAVVALGLLAFILLYERDTLSSGEVAERADRLLERFVRDRVNRVEVKRGGTHTVLVREYEDEEDRVGTWRLISPVEAAVDDDAVESFLGALEWADARRELVGVDEEDRKRFGLTEPALTASFTVADQQVPITVGEQDPTEGGYYVQLDDEETVYVVGKDFFEALDHEPGHFRNKALFPEHDPADAEAFSVADEQGDRALARRPNGWWLTEPYEALASASAVQAALGAVLGAKATRFVQDDPQGLAEWGLAEPALHVRAKGTDVPIGEPSDEGEPWTVALAIGDACGDHAGERYARANEGPLVCVKDADLEPLRKSADVLRQTPLMNLRDADVSEARITRDGATVTLTSEDGDWTWKSGKREGTADSEAVSEWLRKLRNTRVESFEPFDEASAKERGLGKPRATITLRPPGDDEDAEDAERILHLGAVTEEGAWVRRGAEPFAGRTTAAVEDAFEAEPVRFRERTLLQEQDEAAKRIVIERDGTTERLERGDDQAWQVVEPVELAADEVLVGQLVRHLAKLGAERFVAARPEDRHGLRPPRWAVTIRFEGGGAEDGDDEAKEPAPREHVLRIGAAAPGGAYAQLGSDAAVFVVPQGLVDAVEEPLVTRDLLSAERQELASLRIVRGSQTIELSCEDGECAPPDGAPADPQRTRKLLDRLAALRAAAVTEYGPPSDAHGFDAPRAEVTVVRGEDAEESTFVVGETEGEGDAAQAHVRPEAVDVGFVFPAYVIETFLTYEP